MGTTISISGSGNADVKVFGRGTVIAGNGNDKIDITGRGEIIVGSGHDTLTLEHGGVIHEHGASGQDTINIGAGNATIFEQGHATVTGAFGSLTMSGGVLEIHQTHSQGHEQGHTQGHTQGQDQGHHPAAHAQPHWSHGWDYHAGAAGAHESKGDFAGRTTQVGAEARSNFVSGAGSVHGGAALNVVFAAGHESLIGSSGHNLFEFLKTDQVGHHLITNFVAGQDQLYVEGHSLSYLQQHHDISTHGGNTYIGIDGGRTTIELQGVTTLKASDITGKH